MGFGALMTISGPANAIRASSQEPVAGSAQFSEVAA